MGAIVVKHLRHLVCIAALIAGSMFFILPAKAQTADELASKCRWVRDAQLRDQTITQPEDFASGECWGYFGALQNYSRFGGRDGKTLLGICAPAHSRLSQFINIYVAYVDQHPEQGHEDAAFIALTALSRAFPCQPK